MVQAPLTDGASRSATGGRLSAQLGTLALAVALFCGLQWLWAQARGTAVERFVIHGLTVGLAVQAINALTPAVHAVGAASRIQAEGGGINILNGCEGTEIWFLLAAAMAVTPASLSARLAGIAAGALAVFLLNQLRILALFYSFRQDRALFASLHGVLAPLVLVVCALGVYLLWNEWQRRRTAQRAAH